MLRDVPAEQFVDAVGLVIRNVCKIEFKVGAWVGAVQFARADQAIHRGGSLTTAIRASEQEVGPAEGHAAEGIFGKHVADLDTSVITELCEPVPAVQRVAASTSGAFCQSVAIFSLIDFSRAASNALLFSCLTPCLSSGGLRWISASVP